MKIRLAGPCNIDSIVDGPGLRTVIWTQGCPHHCLECHNPQTHNPNGGFVEEVQTIIELIDNTHLQSGITLSGGEPFDQPLPLIEIAKHAKSKKLNVWAFSGYLFEELMAQPDKKALLECCDVLVDGKFEKDKKHFKLKFKGSWNQRIIDVQASLQANQVIFSHYDDENRKLETAQ